tara:strand:+ start:632 stop:907 length:276 start_codon:yes stop_codon:yes gene_type:complete
MNVRYDINAVAIIPRDRLEVISKDLKGFQKFYGYTHRKPTNRTTLRFRLEVIGDYDIHQRTELVNDAVKRLKNWLESKYRIDILEITKVRF